MQVGISSFGPRCGVAVFLLAILSSVCVAQGLDGAGLDSEARTRAEVALEPVDAASLTTLLELGSAQESEVLPAGEFTLEARLPGGRTVTKPVLLIDGQTTDVTIEF